jgi:proteasome lid subunit RPN8/RPN11
MIQQAQAELPNECCGLLAGRLEDAPAGRVGWVLRRLPLVNAAASPREFASEPYSMLRAYKEMRKEGLDLLAIYHSHPSTPAVPSRTDLERNDYGAEVVNLIVSLRAEAPEIRAWRLSRESFEEEMVEWVDACLRQPDA